MKEGEGKAGASAPKQVPSRLTVPNHGRTFGLSPNSRVGMGITSVFRSSGSFSSWVQSVDPDTRTPGQHTPASSFESRILDSPPLTPLMSFACLPADEGGQASQETTERASAWGRAFQRESVNDCRAANHQAGVGSTNEGKGKEGADRDLRVIHKAVYAEVDEVLDQLVHEDLRIGDELGHGNFSSVFEATLMKSIKGAPEGAQVAVKVSKDAGGAVLVHHELMCLFTILNSEKGGGKHINRPLGYNVSVSPFFIVLELVQGATLRTVIEECGSLPVEELVPISKGVLKGLAHAHAVGMIHRDIKSANIMVEDPLGDVVLDDDASVDSAMCKPIVKILDWGESSTVWLGETSTTEVGTFRWMAPEVMCLNGFTPHDYLSEVDIYSFGMVLYEMVSGVLPFVDCAAPVQVAFEVSKGKRPSFSTIEHTCPALLEFIIRMCVHSVPEERPKIKEIYHLLSALEKGNGLRHILDVDEALMDFTPVLDLFDPVVPRETPAAKILLRLTISEYLDLREDQEYGHQTTCSPDTRRARRSLDMTASPRSHNLMDFPDMSTPGNYKSSLSPSRTSHQDKLCVLPVGVGISHMNHMDSPSNDIKQPMLKGVREKKRHMSFS